MNSSDDTTSVLLCLDGSCQLLLAMDAARAHFGGSARQIFTSKVVGAVVFVPSHTEILIWGCIDDRGLDCSVHPQTGAE